MLRFGHGPPDLLARVRQPAGEGEHPPVPLARQRAEFRVIHAFSSVVHVVEVGFQRAEASGPGGAVGRQPLVDLAERFGPEPVHAPLASARTSTRPASRSTRRCLTRRAGCSRVTGGSRDGDPPLRRPTPRISCCMIGAGTLRRLASPRRLGRCAVGPHRTCPMAHRPMCGIYGWCGVCGWCRSGGDYWSGNSMPRSPAGRGPKIRRSDSEIATSLMLASRRRIRPCSSNSHSSLP